MKSTAWQRAGVAAVLVSSTLVVTASSAGAAPSFIAEPLTQTTRFDVAKAPTSRLAQTDRTLLGRTDAATVPVLVKLDYDPVATYAGNISGLPATSPATTGRKLSRSAAERSYESYLAEKENAFVDALHSRVPAAKTGTRLRTVYGGVSVRLPANKVADLLKIDGVVAVQRDQTRQPLTDSSPAFIGATSLYPMLGGKKDAGSGVLIGVLDTGAWPEHPSFADQGNLKPPPGPARGCSYGDNPLTPANDPFVCNNKLVGGAAFLDSYHANFGDERYPGTARDDDGHGTHTMSTSGGNVLAHAEVFGVDRGPVNGIAPGAWVSMYRVCGPQGCQDADSAAAVGQAILDGVNVINFSISGGNNPFTDPVELAFLDAYAAGVFVSASAGNDGPGAATTNHVSPWVTTVAASTQTREFASTLTLTAGDGGTFSAEGASITRGVTTPLPVVLAQNVPGYSGGALCAAPPPASDTFDGLIVACQRGGNARVEKSYFVSQGGGEGMVLYNPTLADIETDNHWVPTVHLADGTDFVAFMTGHTGVTGTFTAGQPEDGQSDVMAAFSSRGPGGFGIKPDITAPGVQILAGASPTPGSPADGGGPPGEYFQAIAGTSMSSPHIAGSAALLKALHPTWTPGQIKSAMMTTAKTDVVKEDLTTKADPFDYGSGRVNLRVADDPGLTFDETPANMLALGNDPVNAVHLNLPSVNAPVMPGRVTTVRTAKNVSGRVQTYDVSAKSPAESTIEVFPKRFTVAPGATVELSIVITATGSATQRFGSIQLVPRRAGMPTLHLPVAFVPQQGGVSLASVCDPTGVPIGGISTCTVTATNHDFSAAQVDLTTTVSNELRVAGATGATMTGPRTVEKNNVTLAGAQPGVPSIAPGASPAGYLPLAGFGVAPVGVGDETIVNFDTPPFVYAGQTFAAVGVTSNGYLVVGGGIAEDVEFEPPGIPNPARPNNVLAPFWTDLNGAGAEGIRVTSLTDGVNDWIVVEWQVNVYGTTSNRHFQTWIGINGVEDISYAYDPAALPADSGFPTVIGAENVNGTGGDQLPDGAFPTEDLRVTSTDPAPGDTVTYEVRVRGVNRGAGAVTTEMDASTVSGTTVVSTPIQVTRR
ncbi:S8 family serine peptidase [Plantactinospora sp. WMMC1484]|uniref:S8 family serine peptidase n=1 Tax=Plantactinospora sp. WMMC1484 TaxID=3404122 RepID=UPI003BF48141